MSFNHSLRPTIAEAMQQAFHVLQMPLGDLQQWLNMQIEQNPILEFEEEGRGTGTLEDDGVKELNFDESHYDALEEIEDLLGANSPEAPEIIAKVSFYDYIMSQIKNTIPEKELKEAEFLIEHLDERGFLTLKPEEISNRKLLETLRHLDPPGIFAFDLKDSLLIQLRLKGKENSLAYQMIEEGFETLIQNKMARLQKKMGFKSSELRAAIHDISLLQFDPLSEYKKEVPIPIIPDIVVYKEEEKWIIEIETNLIPKFRICPLYLEALDEGSLEKEECAFIRKYISSANWLQHVLIRRKKMLHHLALLLIKTQEPFLNGTTAAPAPMNMHEIAEKIDVHESTIARTVSQKYIQCPSGILPLRSFFTPKIIKTSGEEVSNQYVKNLLRQMIHEEDKKYPLTDQSLCTKIQKLGIPCSRRTIAKYRQALKLFPASKRKKWI